MNASCLKYNYTISLKLQSKAHGLRNRENLIGIKRKAMSEENYPGFVADVIDNVSVSPRLHTFMSIVGERMFSLLFIQ